MRQTGSQTDMMLEFSHISSMCGFFSAPLEGTDMTPNYEDANHTDFSISPWCSCRNSGNQEEECEKFLRDFRENTCLRKNHIKKRSTLLKKRTCSRTTVITVFSPLISLVSLYSISPASHSLVVKLYQKAGSDADVINASILVCKGLQECAEPC